MIGDNTMSNQLGQIIGKVRHNGSTTNDNKEKVQLSIIIDFSTASDSDIISWLCSNRFIAGQRPWRSLSAQELEALNGQTFRASSIGQKVKSRQEKVDELTSLGLPSNLAQASVDDPEKYERVMEKVQALMMEEG
jgi:hypothetical protein